MVTDLQKIVIVPDKFKGSLTSYEVANAIQMGIEKEIRNIKVHFDIIQMADGGDGSIEVIEGILKKENKHYSIKSCKVHNPVGKMITAHYLLYENIAFIEMAKVSGLVLLKQEERDPMFTSTFGLGETINHAVNNGATNIYLSIGGSATNDCGMGMLQALGFIIIDKDNKLLKEVITGKDLISINKIEPPKECYHPSISVICDVDNPLIGPNGATNVYAPQKGANSDSIKRLEDGMKNIVNINSPSKVYLTPGAGAAGGVGYACINYLEAKMINGSDYFAHITNLEEKIKDSNIVITGEGKLDYQTLNGKVINKIYHLSLKYKKPLVIFCGINELDENELPGVRIISLNNIEKDISKCMANAKELLIKCAQDFYKSNSKGSVSINL